MKTTIKKKPAHATRDGFAYLTKRKTITKAKAAGREAAKKAMDIMGYVVTTHEDWVVKQFADGTIERIAKIEE